MNARRAVGVDVGGTKIAALRLSSDGSVDTAKLFPTPASDQEAALPAIEGAVTAVMDDDVAAIGIGMAGLIDVRSGVLLMTPNLVWRNLPLAEHVRAMFGVPVTVDNDATAAAWAESRLGASQGHDDSLFVGVGTGIGGGIVLDGRLQAGAPPPRGHNGHRRRWY